MARRLDQFMLAIPRGGYRASYSPSGFFISAKIQNGQNKILLS